MAERVDVLIAGSGFGGAITAFRLAELYHAAGADPRAIVVLERGRRFKHTDFRQSMDVGHLSSVYNLIQGSGAQIVAANAVGGGSNLYLAASLRSPTETFERRDRRPGDGPERRMWPSQISRRSLDPHFALAEAGLRVNRPTWDQVSKSGGLWARTLAVSGHTCDRVPLAISPKRCVNAKWCHTGCIFGAKNSLITNYLPSAERLGARIRPGHRGPVRAPVTGAPVSLRGHGHRPGRRAGGDRVQGPRPLDGRDGQRPDTHAVAQRAARRCPTKSARTSASTATTSPRSSTTPRRSARCSACPSTATSTRASRSPR